VPQWRTTRHRASDLKITPRRTLFELGAETPVTSSFSTTANSPMTYDGEIRAATRDATSPHFASSSQRPVRSLTP
jgi:hypothetical protein